MQKALQLSFSLRLRIMQKALEFPVLRFFSFSFSSVFLDRQAEVFYVCMSSHVFKRK